MHDSTEWAGRQGSSASVTRYGLSARTHGMSRPLLKLSGGSGEMLRDVDL